MPDTEGNLFDRVLDKIFNFIYSKDKREERLLILLIIVGFFLRFIAALNMDVTADDMVYASQSANIINAKIISTHSHPILFFYLTDLSYKVFGYTTLASRFAPLILGTMLIAVVYLIARTFFSRGVALSAAFFATFSNFLVRMTFTEHSLVTFFFVFFGAYMGILHLQKGSTKFLVLSAVFFGLGALTKYNAAFFILAFSIFYIYFIYTKREAIASKPNLKKAILFFVIIFIFALPFLSFNYLIYKDKGILDYQFAKVFKPEKAVELYGGLTEQIEVSYFETLVNPSNYVNYKLIYQTDLLMLVFSLAGLFILTRKKEKLFLVFFLLFLIIPFLLQSANILPKHYAFMHILFSIPAGYSLNALFRKINRRFFNYIIVLFLIAIFIINLGIAYGTPHDIFYKSGTSSLKSYINNNVGDSDLIVFDSRIYTSRSFWLATDNNFLDLYQFVQVYNYDLNLTTQKVPTNIYLVECAIDDCGWGWVSNNQELNKSSEAIINSLRNSAISNQSIPDYEYEKNSGNELIGKKKLGTEYIVHKIAVPMDPNIVQQTKRLNAFYFVSYMYTDMSNYPFNYDVSGIDYLINQLAFLIIYFSVVLSIFSPIFVLFYIILNQD